MWSHPNTRNHNLYHLISTLPKDKTTQLTILFSGMVFEEIFNFFSLYIFQCKMLNPIVAHIYARDYDFNKFKFTLPKNACVQVLDFLTKQCSKKKICFKKCQQIFDKCLIFLLKRRVDSSFQGTGIPFTQLCLCQIWLKLIQRFEKRDKKLQTVGQIDGRQK